VNHEVFQKINFRPSSTRKLKVISCGTLQKRKRPELFISAAEKFPNVDFLWFGEGPLENKVNSEVKNRKLKNLKFFKNIPHEELAKRFHDADIFLFPSIHEGFPKVIIEAMCASLPVIAFKDYEPEAILSGETGYVVSSVKEMFDSLSILINDNELRKCFSEKAVERSKKYQWDKVVNQWESVFERKQ
jgi:glycosyltransferase involved in cell wall biosynthesis